MNFINKFFAEIISIIIIMIVICTYVVTDQIYGFPKGDYVSQHIVVLSNIREYFFQTGVLFPSFIPEFGLGQPGAIYFYYGLTNPLIILLILLKFIPIYLIYPFYSILSIIISVIAMKQLLIRLKINQSIINSVSLMYGFLPVILYHSSYHPMFVTYLPYFTFSLIFIYDILNQQKRKKLFILFLVLGFSMNITFAVQMVYYQIIWALFLGIKFEFTFKKLTIKFYQFFMYYIWALLISLFFIYPQLDLMFNTGKNSGVVTFDYLNTLSFYDFAIKPYVSGTFLFIFVAMLGIFNKKREIKFLSCAIILTLVSNYLIYFLTLFEYIHTKSLIYMNPLVFIALALVLNTTITKRILYVFCSVILFFIYTSVEMNFIFYSILLFQILWILFFNKKFAILFAVTVSFLFVTWATDIQNTAILLDRMDIENTASSSNCSNDLSIKVVNNKRNVVCPNQINTSAYLSILSPSYVDFFYNYIEIEQSWQPIIFEQNFFENLMIENLLFVDKDNADIINLVDSKSLLSTLILDQSLAENKLERIFKNVHTDEGSLNDNFTSLFEEKYYKNIDFISNSNYNNTFSNFSFSKDEIYRFTLNSQCNSMSVTSFQIGNKTNKINCSETPNQKTTHTFYVDGLDLQNDLPVKISGSENLYESIKIEFAKKDALANSMYEYKKVENLKLIYGKGYKFEYNYDDVFMNTIIPYDDNFIIKVDNEQIPITKANNNFLGAQLPNGQHEVEIIYKLKFGNTVNVISISFIILLIFKKKI